MKRLKILLALLFFGYITQAQIYSQRSSAITEGDQYLKVNWSFAPPHYADTTAANVHKGLDSIGAIIYIDVDTSCYYRAIGANGLKYWHKFSTPGSSAVISFNGRNGNVFPTTGDYTAAMVTNAVSTLGGYPDPIWLTSLNWNKIFNTPTTIAGYGITDAVSLIGTQTLTNKTLTSPILNFGGDATGDMYYRAADGTIGVLHIGTVGQEMQVVAGLPSWQNNILLSLVADTPLVLTVRDDSTRELSLLISADPTNSIQVDSDGLYSPNLIVNGLIRGGVVTNSGAGNYTYSISAADYRINGVLYHSPPKTVTLTTADPSLDRIDLFIVTTGDSANFVTGIPATNPVPPALDLANQLQISFADVGAGTTAPTIDITCIYKENTEWTGTSSTVRINLNGVTAPCDGAKDIDGTLVINGDNVHFANPGGTFDPRTLDSVITFKIRAKTPVWTASKSLRFQWYNGTTAVGGFVTLNNGAFGFSSSNTTTCQTISIPLASFGLPPTTVVDNLRITSVQTSGSMGFTLDDICMQGQSVVIPVNTGNFVKNNLGTPAITSDIFANRPAFGSAGNLFLSVDTKILYRDNGTGWDVIGSGATSTTGDVTSTFSANNLATTVVALQGNTLGVQVSGGYLLDSLGHLVWHIANDTTLIRYNGVTGLKLIVPFAKNTLNTPLLRDSTGGIHFVLNSGTDSSITAYLSQFSSSLPGVVPASGGGTTNFLRADGSWAAAGTGTVTSVGGLSPLFTSSGTTAITFAQSNAAAHTYFGNNTGSSAAPSFLTNTQVTADLNLFTSSLQGLVPASGGGTINFLRADGTWAVSGANSIFGSTDRFATADRRFNVNNHNFNIDSLASMNFSMQAGGAFNIYDSTNKNIISIYSYASGVSDGGSIIQLGQKGILISDTSGESFGWSAGSLGGNIEFNDDNQGQTSVQGNKIRLAGDTLKIIDKSLLTASTGYVWVLTNLNGNGAWMPVGGGGGGGPFLPLIFGSDQRIDGAGFSLTMDNFNDFIATVNGEFSFTDSMALGIAAFNTGDTSINFAAFDFGAFHQSQINVTPNTIQLQPQGFATHSAGEVLTLIDPTTGQVDYAPASGGTVTSITATGPLTGGTITTSGSIGIADAVADGSTKGAATFTAADFNSSSGDISIDYTNGQAADGSHKGFLTSTDWTTFNNKAPTASPTFTGTVTIPSPFTLGATSVTTTGTELNYLNAASGTTGTTSTNLVFSASPALTGSPTAPTQSARDNSTKIATTAYADQEEPDMDLVRNALGSSIQWETPWKIGDITVSNSIATTNAYYTPIYIRKTTTITGVKWYQAVAGSYTSNNTNQVGLYSYSGGTLTQVAVSADDGTMWKATGGTFPTKAFTGTYSAAPGLYFIAVLYNSSAQTTAPGIGGGASLQNLAVSSADFTNSANISGFKGSTNSLPGTTIAMSTLTRNTTKLWLALY